MTYSYPLCLVMQQVVSATDLFVDIMLLMV